MKLILKQRFFSWFDSFDIYNEDGEVVFTVKGEFAWGKLLRVYDASGECVGTLKEKMISFLPRFEIYLDDDFAGTVKKEFTLFNPAFDVDYLGWYVEGNFFEYDYTVYDERGNVAAVVAKELFHFTDVYTIDVADITNTLNALMLVLAIDAEKANR